MKTHGTEHTKITNYEGQKRIGQNAQKLLNKQKDNTTSKQGNMACMKLWFLGQYLLIEILFWARTFSNIYLLNQFTYSTGNKKSAGILLDK